MPWKCSYVTVRFKVEEAIDLAVSCRREPRWSELHLSEGNGDIFPLPVYPDYSLWTKQTKKEMRTMTGVWGHKRSCLLGSAVPGCCGWWRKDRWGWSCSSSCTTSRPCKPWRSGSREDQGSCPKLRMDDRYDTSLSHLTGEDKDDFPPLLQLIIYVQELKKTNYTLLSFIIYD